MPEFGNDEDEFYVYLENTINTNPDIRPGTQNGQQVTVDFVVDTFGRPKNIEISNTSDLFMVNLLKTAIDRMPDWIPASKNGIKVKALVKYYLNIRYDGAGHFVVDKAKPLPKIVPGNLALKKAIIGCAIIVFMFYIVGVIIN